MSDLYSIPLKTIDGAMTTLEQYRGGPMLIVNVASRCGCTPQYAALESLYKKYKDRRFVVLGFPCNQFGNQEPGTEDDIRSFCDTNYGVTFPMFAKIDVNGANTHPLYRHLKSKRKGLLGLEAIAWNFTKFLVGPDGDVLKRYGPRRKPADIEEDIARLV
jgi:glutathione peroxidase